MSSFNSTARLIQPQIGNLGNSTFPLRKPRKATPKVPFVLRLECNDHELLRNIAEAEDRSMQSMLRRLAAEAIKKKADELGVKN